MGSPQAPQRVRSWPLVEPTGRRLAVRPPGFPERDLGAFALERPRSSAASALDDWSLRSRSLHFKVLLGALFAWQVFPAAADSLLGNKPPISNELIDRYSPSATASQIQLIGFFVVCIVVIKILLSFGEEILNGNVPLVLLASLPPVVMIGSRLDFWNSGAGIDRIALILASLYIGIVLAVGALRPPLSSLSVLAWIAFWTATLSIVFAFLKPTSSLMLTTDGSSSPISKDLFGVTVLCGPFNHGNTLGVMLACSLPALLLVPPHRRAMMAVPILWALFWSQSRTALISVAVCILVAGVLRKLGERDRSIAAVAISMGLIVATIVLPFAYAGTSAFTYRGELWAFVLGQWKASPIFGLGFGWFSQPYLTAVPIDATITQGHNLWVHSLVTGGLAFASTVFLFLAGVSVRCGLWLRHGQYFPALFFATVLTEAFTEVPLGFGDRWNFVYFVMLPLLVVLLGSTNMSQLREPQVPSVTR